MKPKLLWFSHYGTTSSFSRISGSVLPNLAKHFDITVLSNASEKVSNEKASDDIEKASDDIEKASDDNQMTFVKIGSPTSQMDFDEFSYHMKHKDTITMKKEYILVQMIDLLSNIDFKYLIICNGIYEVSFFVKQLTENRKFLRETKLVVWSPIDYVPTAPIIEDALKADIFFTMTQPMALLCNSPNVFELGHGTNLKNGVDIPYEDPHRRRKIIKILNRLRFWEGSKLSKEDIIILNANNCTSRKKIETTIEAFVLLFKDNFREVQKDPNILKKSVQQQLKDLSRKHGTPEPQKLDKIDPKHLKLWIHTDLKSLKIDLSAKKYDFIRSRLIFSHSDVSDYVLSLIYSVCQISVQTSTGEGFSLTNVEGSLYKSLQVVPDFLACGYHFKDRGLLIPVTLTNTKNEEGHDVQIGVVSEEDTAMKLKQAFKMVVLNTNEYKKIINDAYNYAKGLTWEKVTDQLVQRLGE